MFEIFVAFLQAVIIQKKFPHFVLQAGTDRYCQSWTNLQEICSINVFHFNISIKNKPVEKVSNVFFMRIDRMILFKC